MGCNWSSIYARMTSKQFLEKTYTITDENGLTWRIQKYYNDLKFKNGVLRLDYRLDNPIKEAMPQFPPVQFVQLKSNVGINDNIQTFNDMFNVFDVPIQCGGASNIGSYSETGPCNFIKGKYYQAYIVFISKRMMQEIMDIASLPLEQIMEHMKTVNIKGQLFISSVKQYNGVDGFDDYVTDKKTDEVIKGPTLGLPKNYVKESKYTGYSEPNKLLPNQYSTF